MSSNGFQQVLLSELERNMTVDGHSHTRSRRAYYEPSGYDLFSLISYFDMDIGTTAGVDLSIPEALYVGARSDEEKWLRLRAVLDKARNVSFWRHNLLVYRDLFDLDGPELSDENWMRVNESIRRKTRDPSWYDHVTRDLCRLKTQVRTMPWFEDWDDEYFTGVLLMNDGLQLHELEYREKLERFLNVSIDSLSAAKQALEQLVRRYVERGAIGIKFSHAYFRTLDSAPTPEDTAASAFERALRGVDPAHGVKEWQDHVIFHLVGLAQELDLVVQIHTGMPGIRCDIAGTDPLLLTGLLNHFPRVSFDLFHAGYPYSRALGVLGRLYPNVWLNMAWMYLISMEGSRRLLSEWIDLVPGHRIIGFGSDVHFPEMVYGHLKMARSCVADVLAAKVEHDFLSEEEALSLARRMFLDNGTELYGLPQ